MFKFGSFLVATAVVAMFTGCESKPKTDAELVVTAFNEGLKGGEASFVIGDRKTVETIEADGFKTCSGFQTIAQIKTKENCNVEFEKMSKSGKYAAIYRKCDKFDEGHSYLENVDGQWKVLVRE